MALQFPSDRNSFKGSMQFTFVDENSNQLGEQIVIYQPIGVQLADRVEYENIGLGVLGMGAQEGSAEGLVPSEVIKDPEFRGLALNEIVNKFSSRAGAAARARNRAAPNPNTRALFKQVNLRSFQFSFKFIPTNDGEAKTVLDIVKRFRQELYPADIAGGAQGSLGYKFPNMVKVEFHYDGRAIPGIPKIDNSYIESFTTNLNPTNGAMLQKGGGSVAFSEIDANITLTEARTLNRDKIDEGF